MTSRFDYKLKSMGPRSCRVLHRRSVVLSWQPMHPLGSHPLAPHVDPRRQHRWNWHRHRRRSHRIPSLDDKRSVVIVLMIKILFPISMQQLNQRNYENNHVFFSFRHAGARVFYLSFSPRVLMQMLLLLFLVLARSRTAMVAVCGWVLLNFDAHFVFDEEIMNSDLSFVDFTWMVFVHVYSERNKER